MTGSPEAAASLPAEAAAGQLDEAARMPWRRRASAATLRRDGRLWTLSTVFVLVTFSIPSAVLLWLEPLALPVAALWSAHGWAITRMHERKGARQVVPLGSEQSAARRERADAGAERTALGLLGDLVGHADRELLSRTGLALQPGSLGVWLVGEQGAMMVRPGGRRVDCWCVRVAEQGDLPAADRVAHLLLALREDEAGFATIANLNFSGATWRVRRRLEGRSRPALDRARELARPLDASAAGAVADQAPGR